MLIYKITNRISGKIYVGITTRSLEKRWKEHCNLRAKPSILKNAIKKYGKDNFSIEQIDIAVNRLDLLNKEIYWINTLNTLSPSGYNISLGCQNLMITKETRLKQSNSKKSTLNPNFGGNTTSKPIKCMTTNTLYKSATEAAKILKVNRSCIVKVIKKQRKHVNGYVFEYETQV